MGLTEDVIARKYIQSVNERVLITRLVTFPPESSSSRFRSIILLAGPNPRKQVQRTRRTDARNARDRSCRHSRRRAARSPSSDTRRVAIYTWYRMCKFTH